MTIQTKVSDETGHERPRQCVSVTVNDVRAAILLRNRSSVRGDDPVTAAWSARSFESACPAQSVIYVMFKSQIRTRQYFPKLFQYLRIRLKTYLC